MGLHRMTFKRLHPWEPAIGQIFGHPKLWDSSVDDFAGAAENFVPRQDEAIWYVGVLDEKRHIFGIFALAPQNQICWEVHTRLIPSSWGKEAREAAAALIPWVWENTPCLRLVTSCPDYNKLAIRFAERAGMTRYGVNPASWMKGGKLHDQVLLGISKPPKIQYTPSLLAV